MEHTNIEAAVIGETVTAAQEEQQRQLNELQMVLLGGGMGDPIAF
jgi:hypothetical protein